MPDRAVEDAVARARAVLAVVEKHRGELMPHFHVLIRAIGAKHAHACVEGVFLACVAAQAEEAAVIPFKGDAP